eukprot:m.129891 g.129891  ORF g.129891 m.129891 type:complete len:51 (+) comp9439_c1_seq6:644-796(+)
MMVDEIVRCAQTEGGVMAAAVGASQEWGGADCTVDRMTINTELTDRRSRR